jgi:hypothetical protein
MLNPIEHSPSTKDHRSFAGDHHLATPRRDLAENPSRGEPPLFFLFRLSDLHLMDLIRSLNKAVSFNLGHSVFIGSNAPQPRATRTDTDQ